jgi:predicted Zn-dependent peptidase
MIIAETKKPEEVLEMIDNELKNLSIYEEELERKKKVRKSGSIYRSDSIYSINNKIVSDIMNYNKVIYDDYKKIDKLNIRDMHRIIKEINLDNKTTYIIKP